MKKVSRREFLATGASLTVGTSVFPSIILPRQKRKLGVALVGLGYYSRDLLAPALQLTEHCYLAGVVTGSPEKIAPWQEKYGFPDKNVYNYETMPDVANNPDIDVIYIVLPPSLHMEYSVIAARAGKHVWCEKPMAVTASECQTMIDACNKNKVKLSIGYRMQHEPNTQTIIKWAETKPYGSINLVEAAAGYREGRTDHWKLVKAMGGGAMYDMGVYSLNAARYSTGLEPVAVTARMETSRPEMFSEVDETMHFNLEFPEGVKADCITSFGQSLNRLHVDCQNGWYELQPFQAYSGIQGTTSDGKNLDKSVPNQQAKQMDDDSLAIINKTPVLVPGEEGMRDIRIVEAIYKSAESGSRVTL